MNIFVETFCPQFDWKEVKLESNDTQPAIHWNLEFCALLFGVGISVYQMLWN